MKNKIQLIDCAVLLVSLILPLFIFQDKSTLFRQLITYALALVTYMTFYYSNPLWNFKNSLAVFFHSYTLVITTFSTFLGIAILSFLHRDFEYSRTVNLTGLTLFFSVGLFIRKSLWPEFVLSDKTSGQIKTLADSKEFAEHLDLLQNPKAIKRVFDFVLAFILLILVTPLIAISAMLIFFNRFENPFFLQKRMGWNGKPFTIVKLKTLFTARMETTFITRMIRLLNIDELPQLFNILRGEMTFVGPRPETLDKQHTFAQHHYCRHDITPGLTGLWQLSEARVRSISEHPEYDFYYMLLQSFWFDVTILAVTPLYFIQKK